MYYFFNEHFFILSQKTLISQRKIKRFYPTRLAIQLANGVDNNFQAKGEKGFIIVETNQRVYAYTSYFSFFLNYVIG